MSAAAMPADAMSARRHDPRHALVRRALVLPAQRLGDQVLSGASFTFLGIAVRTVLTFGSVAVLARLLTPADFGYIAMAVVVTELAGLLGSFGLGNILIQQRVLTRLQLDTVFWASVLLGTLTTALVWALASAGSLLFKHAQVADLLRLMSLSFVLGSLSAVHEALLARLMRFRTDFYLRIGALTLRAATAIAFAWAGFGVWSLALGPLAGSLALSLLMFAAVPYRPRLRWHAAWLRARWRTGGSYLGNTLLYYLMMNIDLVLIGRQLGADALGHYQNARALTDELRGRIAMPLQRVLFPALSALQAEPERLRHSVLRAARLLAAIVCPLGFGLSAVASELVPVLYGAQWLAMVPVLTLLGAGAALRAASSISTSIFNARNRVGLALRYNLAASALLVASLLFSIDHGLPAVSAAVAANALFAVLMLQVSFRLVGLGWAAVGTVLGPPLLAGLAMWTGVALLRGALAGKALPDAALLAVLVGAGALLYPAILHLLSRQYLADFSNLARRLLHPAAADKRPQ